jgi:outer membrane protein OmpA-like peptidoglycan-associated protein
MRKFDGKAFITLLIFSVLTFIGHAQEGDGRIFSDSTLKMSAIKANTLRSDFGPAVVGDSLYFTSYSDKVLGHPDDKLRKKAFYDLYWAKIDKEGNTTSNRAPLVEFLTRYHDGPVAYCQKTGELFVTQSDNIEAAVLKKMFTRDTIRLRIVVVKRVNGKWTSFTNFPYNNKAYSVGHPAISVTGDTLIFSSDRHGGFGETDLYCSIRKNGKWGNPFNMGSQINTSGKEEFPFIYQGKNGNSHLIFASTGRFGLGGLDIYYTKFPFKDERIEHFDAPINSKYDDFDMEIRPDVDNGFMTSNRPGRGSDDIYQFSFKRLAKSAVPVSVPYSPVRELYVYNSKTGQPIPGTVIVSCDSTTYSTDEEGKVDSLSSYKNSCEVLATRYGYEDRKKKLITKVLKQGEINRDTIWMDPIMGKIILYSVYYDFNRWNILPEAARELDKLVEFLKENPDFKVQLSSHTDSRGNAAYNLWLSQKRAMSAVSYITSHGIRAGRITGRGYGETQLLNRCEDGALCTPQEHRQNRRTEIYIPEYGKSLEVPQTEGQYSGKSGEASYSSSYGSSTYAASERAASRSGSSRDYYVVLNSFLSKSNAEKFLMAVTRSGIPAQIVSENEYYRIGIKKNSFGAAMDARDKLRGVFADCWIL